MPRSRSPSPSRADDRPRSYRDRNSTPPPRSRHHNSTTTTRRTHRRRTHTPSRSRSPSRHHHQHHHRNSRHDHRSRGHSTSPPPVLPGNVLPITKHDYDAYKPLFAEYLDVQKGLVLAELSTREAQGRFKRFVTHWNRGELAKGWYDPSRKATVANTTTMATTTTANTNTAEDASARFLESLNLHSRKKLPPHGGDGGSGDRASGESDSDASSSTSDEIVGPLPPGYDAPGVSKRGKKAAATMPTIEDLDLQKEQITSSRLADLTTLRASRRADRALQKERLDELVPRPTAGSHEAKLEKKKLLSEKLNSFRDKSPDMDLPDAELMGGGGGGGGGTDSFKQLKAAKERKKNERELRKEAILRQRMEEREGRLRMHREKEERTIAMLRALAESAQRGGGAR